MPEPQENRIIFVSHSSQDREAALTIVQRLELLPGHRCWVAPRDVPFGSDYPTAIIDAIKSCDVFLLLLTQHSNTSQNVHREVERAADRNKPLLTVRLDQVPPAPALEFFVSSSQWANAEGLGAAGAAELIANLLQGRSAPVRRHRVFTSLTAAALVLTLALASGLAWYQWRPPQRSANETASVFLNLWDKAEDSAALKHLSPKVRNIQSAEVGIAQLAHLRQQAGGSTVERAKIADLQYPAAPMANGVMGLGQFRHLRFRARTPVMTRCEDLWLESPEPGRWEVLAFNVWVEPGESCLDARDIREATERARGVLVRIDANKIAARDPEVFSAAFVNTMSQEQAEEYLNTFRKKGAATDRRLLLAFPTARCPITPAPGHYVFIRFHTAVATGTVVEDLWMEKPADGSNPRIVNLFWAHTGH